MSGSIEVPERVADLAGAAAERAFGWLETDETFMGFLVLDATGIPMMPIERSDPAARSYGSPLVLAQDTGPLREFVTGHRGAIDSYAIALDVVIRDDETGETSAAVCVEAGERGGPHAFVFIEAYVKDTSSTPPVRSRRFAVAEVTENLLVDGPATPAS